MRNGGTGQKWEPEEDQLLAYWQSQLGNKWAQVAKHIPGRTGQQCAQRWRHTNPTISKGKWTPEEDEQLAQLVDTCGVGHWAEIARHMAGRTDQQCLARWTRHLDPSINRGNWSEQEDAMLLQLYEQLGSNWSRIAKGMKVRIPHQCRSRYNVLTRGSAARAAAAAAGVQGSRQGQHKRRRKGGAHYARIGSARWKKPKWAKADWEGESDSQCDDENLSDEAYDNEQHETGEPAGEHFEDDAEEAAALLTSFQRSAEAASAYSSGTCTVLRSAHEPDQHTEHEQWQQQEWQQQQHWEQWQHQRHQQQDVASSDPDRDAAAPASAVASLLHFSSSAAADMHTTVQLVQQQKLDDVYNTGGAVTAELAPRQRKGSSAGSSKSSSSNIGDISGTSSSINADGCMLMQQHEHTMFEPVADYSGALAAVSASVLDASSRNTSPEYVQQPPAVSAVANSTAAAAAAVVAALLGSGGMAAAVGESNTYNITIAGSTAAYQPVDAASLMAALSKYAAAKPAVTPATTAMPTITRSTPCTADAESAAVAAGLLSKSSSCAVPAGVVQGLSEAAAGAAAAPLHTAASYCTPVSMLGSKAAVGTSSKSNNAPSVGVTTVMTHTSHDCTIEEPDRTAAAAAVNCSSAARSATHQPLFSDVGQAVLAGQSDVAAAAAIDTSSAPAAPGGVGTAQQQLLQWLRNQTVQQATSVQLPAVPPLSLPQMPQLQAEQHLEPQPPTLLQLPSQHLSSMHGPSLFVQHAGSQHKHQRGSITSGQVQGCPWEQQQLATTRAASCAGGDDMSGLGNSRCHSHGSSSSSLGLLQMMQMLGRMPALQASPSVVGATLQ